jgi:hypothetical protein
VSDAPPIVEESTYLPAVRNLISTRNLHFVGHRFAGIELFCRLASVQMRLPCVLPLKGATGDPGPLRYLEIEVMALGAVILRHSVLMMAKVAIEGRAVVGGCVGVYRLDGGCLIRKLFGIVACLAALHTDGLPFLGLAMA